ncbi:MAG: hypothetical protein WCQ16_08620 [Verrucomicrobiae bacterium]
MNAPACPLTRKLSSNAPENRNHIAGSLHALNRQAVREYTPIVEGILRSHSRDADHIEHTLDGLVSFCGYAPALVLYKKLCRHFWEIDPAATAWHIHAYREMWDSEEAGEDKSALNLPDGGLTK